MKKVLEGELLSIVHRVLQMKDTDVDKLYVEAKELYEKLQILKFYQDNLALGLVNDIAEDQLVAKLSAVKQAETSEQEIAMIAAPEEEDTRSQIPADLIMEDYPIVVEAEKETVVDFDAPTLVEEEIEEDEDEEEKSLEFEQEEEDELANEMEEEQDEEAEAAEFAALVEEEIEEETEEEQDEELEEEEEEWTEEDTTEVLEEEELADQVVAETTENEQTFEFQEEKTEEEVFAPLTGDQREDNPFEGFDFGEIEFIRVEDLAKEDTILVDDSMFERVGEQTTSVEENQSTDNFFAQQKEEQTIQQEEKEEEKEDKVENQQNMLFNLDQVSVREPRIVKKSINDIYRGTIVVGLNDRIAFEKHLFANSSEDFNRVLSQLNTVSTYDEARSFVEHLVKPEYNNWEGKEEYAERFMTLIEKRFE
ncbi:chemotaxis protein histidine kinase CheA [Myroides gitamensis]|uniref:hypothetical protein n=1 Tax=Myroides odoratus TaxID=256 RepID=UPI002169ABEC|nr:hypothetical protein [Myroides odoratus]MCS4237206.1 chemotaxis protein histidine kinase CheA [Myroides odoratus]MDH6602069.1 chemotaxis protein histidine kinase CheA [Myroides gitamensis]